MNIRKSIISIFIIFICLSVQAKARNIELEESNLRLVTNFYEQFFNQHDTKNSVKIISDDYIQHNPDVPDGKLPFINYFIDYFKSNPLSKAKIIRSATNGDLVFLHVHATNGVADKGQAVLDIFRVHNDIIVEHWDVIQEVPETSENKNTMF